MNIIFEEPLTNEEEKMNVFKAFILSYQEDGHVDLERIAKMSDLRMEDVLTYVSTYIVQDPVLFDLHHDFYRDYELIDDYLSGEIYEKLKEAKRMNEKYGGYFQRNVDLLRQKIQPMNYKKIIDGQVLFEKEIECYSNKEVKLGRNYIYAGSVFRERTKSLLDILNGNYAIDGRVYEKSKDVIPSVVQYLKNSKDFEKKTSYFHVDFQKDPFFFSLMHPQSIIVESDNEKRMYMLLLIAGLYIHTGLEEEVTILVGSNMKMCLKALKDLWYPSLKIHILTGKEYTKTNAALLIDESVDNMFKYFNKQSRLVICLSHMEDKMLEKLHDYFFLLHQKEKYIYCRYLTGYALNSTKTFYMGVTVPFLKHKYDLFHRLSSILCMHYEPPLLNCFGYYQEISKEDQQLCDHYIHTNGISISDLVKQRTQLSIQNKIDEVVEDLYLRYLTSQECQLVYVDQSESMDLLVEKLLQLQVPLKEIQVMKKVGKVKKARFVIAKSAAVYPFQVPDLGIVHHLDIPKNIATFYKRHGDVLHHFHILRNSIDTFYLQSLYFNHLFMANFNDDYGAAKLFLNGFKQSSTRKEIIQLEKQRMEMIDFQISHVIEYLEEDKFCFEKDYVKLKRKKQMNALIESLVDMHYFDGKEKYLITMGNISVIQPKNMIAGYPYVILEDPFKHRQNYAIKKGNNHYAMIVSQLTGGM